MRKSVMGLTLGLIGSIIFTIWGFYAGIISDFIRSTTESMGANIEALIGWICFLFSILGIVGASLCTKKARLGGILILIAALFCIPQTVYSIYNVLQTNFMVTTICMLSIIPTALLVTGSVCALCAKKIES